MTTNPNDGSAKIYQFPAGGRAARDGQRDGKTKPAIDQTTPPANAPLCSGSWYHEEAIREAVPSWE